MPAASVTLPDIEQSAARPIVYQVISQLMKYSGLSENTKIVFKGHAGFSQTAGTSIDNRNRDAQFSTDRYTFIEVDENYQPSALQETFVHDYENKAVFSDKKLSVLLAPVYTPSDVTINVKYRANSETEVKRWAADMFMRISRGKEYNLHVVEYTFPLAYEFLGLLEDIWKLREATAGYGDDFKKYMTDHSSSRLTLVTNIAGEMPTLSICESQTRIIGRFDIEGIPEKPMKEQSSGTWEISFAYKFSYQRPDGMFIKYPVCVHQSCLPEKYQVFAEDVEDPSQRATYRSNSIDSVEHFEQDYTSKQTRKEFPYIRIPNFDDFLLDAVEPGTATVMTVLCSLDEGKKDLVSLNDLGDYLLDPILIPYFVGEIDYMLKYMHSLIYVSVYEDGILQDLAKFEVTSDLMIRAKEPLNPRKTYRVRVALLVDINLLLWDAIGRLRRFPAAFVVMLGNLNELLRINPDFQSLRSREIKDYELSYVFWILTNGAGLPHTDYPWNDALNDQSFNRQTGGRLLGSISNEDMERYFRMKPRNMLTVMNSAIITRRKENDLGTELGPI